MKKLFFFLAIIAFSVAQTDADQAEGILESLLLDAQQNLSDLDTNWGVNSGLLMENVNTWQTTLEGQTEQCTNKDTIRDDTQEELNENTFKIQWIGEQNVLKAQQSEDLYSSRCEANRNYINGLKNDKILLKLIGFLREAVQNHQGMNLIQKRQFAQTMMEFITLYRTNNTKDLLQLHLKLTQEPGEDHVEDAEFTIDNGFDVSERTDEQIGDDHVDEEREALELEGFQSNTGSSYTAMLELFDEFEQEIHAKMAQMQEDEIAAGITAAEYRIRLDKEVQELDSELYVQVTSTPRIEQRLILSTAAALACSQELTRITTSFQEAQAQFTSAQDNYNGKSSEINDEIEIFEYVLGLYQENVSGEEYREQLDDYTVDGGYEGSYNEREVDDVDFLTPQEEQPPVEEIPVEAPVEEEETVGAPVEEETVGAPVEEEETVGGAPSENHDGPIEEIPLAPEQEEETLGAPVEEIPVRAPEQEEEVLGAPVEEEEVLGAPVEEIPVRAPEQETVSVDAPVEVVEEEIVV